MVSKKVEITEVPDFNGTPTHIGDKVVFITRTYCTAKLALGKVIRLSKVFGQKCIVIDDLFNSKSTSQSFYKIAGE